MVFPEFNDVRIAAAYLLLTVIIVLASWKYWKRQRGESGGEPELYGTSIILLSITVQVLLYSQQAPVFSYIDLNGLLVDSILLVGFVAIALNANRIWPLIAAGAQLVGMFSHFSRAMQLDIAPMAYSILRSAPTILVGMCVIIGFVSHFDRMKRFGRDRDWMDWSQTFGLGPSRG